MSFVLYIAAVVVCVSGDCICFKLPDNSPFEENGQKGVTTRDQWAVSWQGIVVIL